MFATLSRLSVDGVKETLRIFKDDYVHNRVDRGQGLSVMLTDRKSGKLSGDGEIGKVKMGE